MEFKLIKSAKLIIVIDDEVHLKKYVARQIIKYPKHKGKKNSYN